jgi:hypothetical protein
VIACWSRCAAVRPGSSARRPARGGTASAIDARERHFQVTVLRDACATVDPVNERIALDYLERVTGTVIATVQQWREGDGADTRAVQAVQSQRHA